MADQHSDEGKSKIVTDNSDEDENIAQIASKTSKSEDVAEKKSDASEKIAQSGPKKLKSEDIADKSSDASAISTNATVKNSESTVEINIKTLDSQLHNFNVDKSMPVSIFKEKIASEVGLPFEQQRLIFRGKALKDDDPLSEYHVENGDTLHLVARQPSGSPNIDTTARSTNTGQDANVTGHMGHISHSVVLGTFGAGDQDENNNPDISQVIGAVLNSFGIAGQGPTGGHGATQPNMQFSVPVQVAQRNELGASVDNHGQSMPAVPTLSTPIPDSLHTLSEFMNHMEQTLSQNGYQPSNNTENQPSVEFPSNSHPSPTDLAVVMRHAQRLLSGPAVDSLSNTARRLDEERSCSDVTLRTQIQTETMQSGLAMQHLGALLLELGRTMLTLRIEQSSAESSVNAGPAVYISPSGPNPIMVQPFPLQTNSLFGVNPVGIGVAPRHLNILIHAGSAGVNSQSQTQTRDNWRNAGQTETVLPEVRTDARLSETESGLPSSQRNNGIPLGLGPGGLQRRHRPTRSEAGSSSASTSTGGQVDPTTILNQNPDFMRNLMTQLAQNPQMMNTVNQIAQQMDGNQDLGSMMAAMGGGGGGGDMIQQMMPFVSQALNHGSSSSSSNMLQSTPPRKGTLHRRYSSVKNMNVNERPTSDFQMNLENVAQKIVEQYPPLEIFSSIVETAAGLHNNVYEQTAIDALCLEEELALEFMEMLKHDISRRIQGGR